MNAVHTAVQTRPKHVQLAVLKHRSDTHLLRLGLVLPDLLQSAHCAILMHQATDLRRSLRVHASVPLSVVDAQCPMPDHVSPLRCHEEAIATNRASCSPGPVQSENNPEARL